MSVGRIGWNLFSGHPINTNHVHTYTKDILSVIINLETNGSGDQTVFME